MSPRQAEAYSNAVLSFEQLMQDKIQQQQQKGRTSVSPGPSSSRPDSAQTSSPTPPY